MRSWLPVLLLAIAACSTTSDPGTAAPADAVGVSARVYLQHALVAEVAPILEEVFATTVTSRRTLGAAADAPVAAQAALRIVPHPDTNSLLLIGSGEQVAEGLDLIQRLDVVPETSDQRAR